MAEDHLTGNYYALKCRNNSVPCRICTLLSIYTLRMCDMQIQECYSISKGESDVVEKGDLTMVKKCGESGYKVENR